MNLILPTERYKDSYIAAIEEFQKEGRFLDKDIAALKSDFSIQIKRFQDRAAGRNLPDGQVQETVYWLIDAEVYIGRVSIRHELTPNLLKFGGNVGYDIRPSMRRKGYGTQVLKLALPKAKELGLTKALLTCDETNVGSRKIIESNGGILENRVEDAAGGPAKLRYWIKIV